MKNRNVLLIGLLVFISVFSITVIPTVANYGEVQAYNRAACETWKKRLNEVYWERAITLWTTSWIFSPEGGPPAWVPWFDGSEALAVGSWGEGWGPDLGVYTQTDMLEIWNNYEVYIIVDGKSLLMDMSPPRKWKESADVYGWVFRVGLSYKPGAFMDFLGGPGEYSISWETYLYGELDFDSKDYCDGLTFVLY